MNKHGAVSPTAAAREVAGSESSPEDCNRQLSSSDDQFAQHESLPSDIAGNDAMQPPEVFKEDTGGINSGL